MRFLFSLMILLALTAAGPVDDWRALMKAGKNKEVLAQVRKAADTGDPVALDRLAWFYDEGHGGVAADKKKAADYYRQAAEKGEPHAEWRYGVMLDTGEGVALDSTAAMGWFRKSAAQKFSNAYVSMGVMYSGGRGVDRNYAKALDCYRQAAKLHNIHAFNEIGVVFLNGEGVPPDKIEATAYFIIAAAHGDSRAQQQLNLIGNDVGEEGLKRAADRATALSKEFDLEGAPDRSGLTT
jgi:TPR repeat protein